MQGVYGMVLSCEYTMHVHEGIHAHIGLAVVVVALGLDAVIVSLACRALPRAAQPEQTLSSKRGMYGTCWQVCAWCPILVQHGAPTACRFNARLPLSRQQA